MINCVVIVSYVIVNYIILKMPFDSNEGSYAGRLLLPIVLSAFESYIESKTNETITNGFQSATEFRIITDKPEEMSDALMKVLSRGITALPAKGMYTKEEHTMLLCVVSRRQVPIFRKVIKQIDPDSFVVMSKVAQVWGLGFYTQELQ